MTTEEKVIDRQVIGSSNPIARKFRDVMGAIKGVGFGFVLLIVGMVLIYFSVTGVKEYSKIVEALPLQTPTKLAESGMIKTSGQLKTETPLIFEYKKCSSAFGCKYPAIDSIKVENLMYYSATWERFELVKEVRTETRVKTENGQDIQETVEVTEYNEKWVEKKSESKWAQGVKLDNIAVVPANAIIMMGYEDKSDESIYIEGLGALENYGKQVSSEVGKTRIKISFIGNTKDNIILVGEIQNKSVSSGEPFIITDKNDSGLVESLASGESTQRLVIRVLAWLALAIGFGSIIAPLMEIVEIIPIFGKSIKGFAGLVGAVLSAIIVVAGVFIIKYWVIILLLTIILIVGIVVLIVKKTSSK